MRCYLGLILFSATLVNLPVLSGCAARVRIYDEANHDYHRWNHDEGVFYLRWEVETHRDHKNFKRRNEDEKQEYWHWRHAQR